MRGMQLQPGQYMVPTPPQYANPRGSEGGWPGAGRGVAEQGGGEGGQQGGRQYPDGNFMGPGGAGGYPMGAVGGYPMGPDSAGGDQWGSQYSGGGGSGVGEMWGGAGSQYGGSIMGLQGAKGFSGAGGYTAMAGRGDMSEPPGTAYFMWTYDARQKILEHYFAKDHLRKVGKSGTIGF